MLSALAGVPAVPCVVVTAAFLMTACSPASNDPAAAAGSSAPAASSLAAAATSTAGASLPTASASAPAIATVTSGAASAQLSASPVLPSASSIGASTASVPLAAESATAPVASLSASPSGAASVAASAPSVAASTNAPDGLCDAADVLCADFDALTPGSLPSGAPWLAAPGHCSATGYQIAVESGTAVSGMQALVSSNASTSTNACALVADLGEQTDFWVRAQVRYVGTGPTNEHEITFFELGEHADQDDPEGRVGFRADGCNATDGAPFPGLEFNMTKGPGGEFTGCTGVQLEADRWYCVEVHVNQTASPASGELYLDGAVQSFTNHGSPVEEVLSTGGFRYLKLGAQTYGGINTGPLVLDDVAVSTSRVGCP